MKKIFAILLIVLMGLGLLRPVSLAQSQNDDAVYLKLKKRWVAPSGGGGGTWTAKTDACVGSGGSTSTSITCTFVTGTNFASGYSGFCAVSTQVSGLTYTVTDSHGNTWTLRGSQFSSEDSNNYPNYTNFFDFQKLSTAITSITFNNSGTTGLFPLMFCQDASDSGSSPAYDSSAGICAGRLFSSPASCPSSLSLTGNDYVLCLMGSSNSASVFIAGTGFTLGGGTSLADGSQMQYGVFSSGLLTPSYTASNFTAGTIGCAGWTP